MLINLEDSSIASSNISLVAYLVNIEENKLVKVGLGNYIIKLLLKCLRIRAA